ncbi:MAG: hypothetical protein R3D34_15865 [Nitratireductor sp.]
MKIISEDFVILFKDQGVMPRLSELPFYSEQANNLLRKIASKTGVKVLPGSPLHEAYLPSVDFSADFTRIKKRLPRQSMPEIYQIWKNALRNLEREFVSKI